MYEFFRELLASEQPVLERFNIVDPTAVGNNVRSITLAYTPATSDSPTAAISLFWSDSKNKVYEKSFKDENQAKGLYQAMQSDLKQAADLTKQEKTDAAGSLVKSLFKKYAVYTDEIVDGNPAPVTTTNADLKLSKVQNPLVNKTAKVVMQNLFFETPEELMAYQEKLKGKKAPGTTDVPGAAGDFKDDLTPPKGDEVPGQEPGDGLAPGSLSYEDYEKQKGTEQKSLTKRIEHEVKEQVRSALEQKIASTFDSTDDDLIDAMRAKGRTWEEIKNYFTKELQYDKDSTAAYIDALREAEMGKQPAAPAIPGETPETEPSAPKPPTDLVSPETHDKLVKEVTDETQPAPIDEGHEIPKQEMALGEIAFQNTEITKIAEEPLETVPKGQNSMGEDFEFLPDKNDTSDEMKDEPSASPDPGDPTMPAFDQAPKIGDNVWVSADYETGRAGFSTKLLATYKSNGEEYGVVAMGDHDSKDFPMRFLKKAFFGRLVRLITARRKHHEGEKARKANSELQHILKELKQASIDLQAASRADANAWVRSWVEDDEIEGDPKIQEILNTVPDEAAAVKAVTARVQQMLYEKGYSDYIIQNVQSPDVEIDRQQIYSIIESHKERAWETKTDAEYQQLKQQLQTETDPAKKQLIQQRLDELNDMSYEGSKKEILSKTSELTCPKCGGHHIQPAEGYKLNKCLSCHFAFDSESSGEDKTADAIVDGAKGAPLSLFNVQTAPAVIARIKNEVKAPYISAYPSTLGGDENVSIMMTISMDPKEKWENGIKENSNYANFSIDNDGTVEAFSGPLRFRKRNVKSVDDLIKQLNSITVAAPPAQAPAAPAPTQPPVTSSLKVAAPGDVKPTRAVPTQAPTEPAAPEIVGPELTQPKKIAPPDMRKEQPVQVSPDTQKIWDRVQDTASKLDKIETIIVGIMKEAQEKVRSTEQEYGKSQLTNDYLAEIKNLYQGVEAMKAQVVEFDNTLMQFINDPKTIPVKWTAAEQRDWLLNKFPEAEKRLQNAMNGAQSEAKKIIQQKLVPFPKAESFQLSKFDKRADPTDMLNYIKENLKAAHEILMSIMGPGSSEPQPA